MAFHQYHRVVVHNAFCFWNGVVFFLVIFVGLCSLQTFKLCLLEYRPSGRKFRNENHTSNIFELTNMNVWLTFKRLNIFNLKKTFKIRKNKSTNTSCWLYVYPVNKYSIPVEKKIISKNVVSNLIWNLINDRKFKWTLVINMRTLLRVL